MGFLKKKKLEEIPQEEIEQQRKEKTAQDWIPVADIEKNILYRKDKVLAGALRIQPENLELLSDREKERKVEALAEELNGENEDMEIFCIGRPVDLNNYLEWLQEKAKMESDFTRKMLLKGYIQQASQLASGGEMTERRFYFIFKKPVGNKAELELISKLTDFTHKLAQAELVSHVCSDDELLEVLSLFANPLQASVEKAEVSFDLPPLLVE